MAAEEFLLEEDKPLKPIVGEEAIKFGPNGVGVIAVAHHRVEQIFGDGGRTT